MTNFPNSGDNKKISLNNSKYPQFDRKWAEKFKEKYPKIWSRGDKTPGDDAFIFWGRVRETESSNLTDSDKDWIKRRERYFDRFRRADKTWKNALGHVKWGGYTNNLGVSAIKKILNDRAKEVTKMSFELLPCKLEIKSIKEDDNDCYMVMGYASVYGNVDLGRDIVMSGAFTEDLALNGNSRPILWQHASFEPIGKGVFYEDEKGLKVEMMLPKDDDFVKGRVMPQVKTGSVTGMSIGYMVDDYEYDERARVRKLKRCQLKETSLVTFPMNEQARVTAMKQYLENFGYKQEDSKGVPAFKNYAMAGNDVKWDKKRAIKDIKNNTGSNESPGKNYKNGFMFYDPENADNYGGYKMPFVYYMDGEFKAVPKALSSIVGALAGARGGVDIPESDVKKIKDQLNKYYKKMGREEPFKSGKTLIDLSTLKALDIKYFHIIFDKDTILSNSAKDAIYEGLNSVTGQNSDTMNSDLQELAESFRESIRKSNEITNKYKEKK